MMGAGMIGDWRFRVGLALAILVAFLWSLLLPVVYDGQGSNTGVPGWIIAGFGWLGVLQNQWGWFGNFGILVAIVFLLIGRRIPLAVALIFAIPTALCEINAMMWKRLPNENQGLIGIQAFGSGYWLWLAIMTVSVAAMLLMIRPRRPSIPPASR